MSTITNADQILVLHSGIVAESGTHDELLAKKGRYANMWKKQIRFERAAEEAKLMSDRADALRKEAMIRPGSRDGAGSEDASDNEADNSATLVPSTFDDRTLGRAAESHHGSTALLRGYDDGKPPGHP